MNSKYRKTIEAYDTDPEYYSQKFRKVPVRSSHVDVTFSYVSNPKPRCLELGCGDGRDAEYIIAKCGHYIGVDASSGFLEIAKNRLPDATFICDDFTKAEFKESSFDIIYAFASLLHLDEEDIKDMFQKVYTWLDNGGIFFISLKYGEYHEFEKQDPYGVRYFYFYTPEDIAELSKGLFHVKHESKSNLFGVNWFEMVLKKVS